MRFLPTVKSEDPRELLSFPNVLLNCPKSLLCLVLCRRRWDMWRKPVPSLSLSRIGHLSVNTAALWSTLVNRVFLDWNCIPVNYDDRRRLFCLFWEGQTEVFSLLPGDTFFLIIFPKLNTSYPQTSYCSRNCQKENWKTHKKSCKNYLIKVKI